MGYTKVVVTQIWQWSIHVAKKKRWFPMMTSQLSNTSTSKSRLRQQLISKDRWDRMKSPDIPKIMGEEIITTKHRNHHYHHHSSPWSSPQIAIKNLYHHQQWRSIKNSAAVRGCKWVRGKCGEGSIQKEPRRQEHINTFLGCLDVMHTHSQVGHMKIT